MKVSYGAAKVIILLSALLLFGLAGINLVHTITQKTEFLDHENRYVTPFPELNGETLISGKFAERVDLYLNDRFWQRSAWIEWRQRLEEWKGIPEADGAEIITVQGSIPFEAPEGKGEDRTDDTSAAPDALQQDEKGVEYPSAGTDSVKSEESGSPEPEEEEALPPSAQPSDSEGIVNSFLILGNRGYELPRFKDASAQYYADSLRMFTDKIDSDIPVFSIVVPSGFEFTPPNRFDHLGKDQEDNIAVIHQKLGDRFIPIDAHQALRPHGDEYIYFRTDHHWTARGAYYVYRAFIESRGREPYALERYQTRKVTGFLGSLYNQTQSARLKKNADVVTAYLPFVHYDYEVFREGRFQKKEVIDFSLSDRSNKYQIFISSDSPVAVLKNHVHKDKKLLIFKDSYGNAFVPFLMPHYKEIHIIDPRYFEHNVVQYTQEHDIDEVIFFNYYPVISIVNGYAYNVRRVVGLPWDETAESVEPDEPDEPDEPPREEAEAAESLMNKMKKY